MKSLKYSTELYTFSLAKLSGTKINNVGLVYIWRKAV